MAERKMVPPPPDPSLPLTSNSASSSSSCHLHGDTFTLFSYNILSPHLTHFRKYENTPESIKDWHQRRPKLIYELDKYEGDIFCLQGMSQEFYYSDFKPYFESRGYSCRFTPKQVAFRIDGCAIFYKVDKFSLVKEYDVSFRNLVENFVSTLAPCSTSKFKELLLKDNIAVATVLQNVQGPKLCVVNTHLIANPERLDTKLWQVAMLLKGIGKLVGKIPLILSGDFNALPISNPVNLVVGNPLHKEHKDLKNDNYGIFRYPTLSHGLKLKSVYPIQGRKVGHVTFIDSKIDYIFYDDTSLQLHTLLDDTQLLPALRKGQILSLDNPSDQYPIGAEFSYKKFASTRGPAAKLALVNTRFESIYLDEDIRVVKDIRNDYLVVDRAPYNWEE